jgi:hypothetical protein
LSLRWENWRTRSGRSRARQSPRTLRVARSSISKDRPFPWKIWQQHSRRCATFHSISTACFSPSHRSTSDRR